MGSRTLKPLNFEGRKYPTISTLAQFTTKRLVSTFIRPSSYTAQLHTVATNAMYLETSQAVDIKRIIANLPKITYNQRCNYTLR